MRLLSSRFLFFVAALGAVTLIPSWTAAQTTVGPMDDVEAAINGLGPGDELIIEDGTYTLDSRFSFDIAGTPDNPIVIRAADGANPHFDRPQANQNIIDIDNAEHVIIRGLEFSGGSAGIRVSSARFLTIEDCDIHDTGDVAVRFNDGGAAYEGIRILRNHIYRTNDTGEGMYLGCNNDNCQLFDSLIEGNYVHNTDQPSVNQGDGIEIKEGSYNNIIRDNVIHDTNYPCILTYSTVGNGPPNIIERNVLWGCGDHAIQSAADAIIRNNIILSANNDGIAMQPHQSGSPSNLMIVNNTIIKSNNSAISVRGMSGSVTIANNALYAMGGNAVFVNGGDSMLTMANNIGMGSLSGTSGGWNDMGALMNDFTDANWSGQVPNNVWPADGSPLIGAGDPMYAPADDFNGNPRSGTPDVGAYAWAMGGNPGWTLSTAFKDQAPVITPQPDGGTNPDGGPRPDSGRPPADGGSGSDASTGGGDSDGCCSVAAQPSPFSAALIAAVAGLLLFRRRRR